MGFEDTEGGSVQNTIISSTVYFQANGAHRLGKGAMFPLEENREAQTYPW